LLPEPDRPMECCRCGQLSTLVHDVTERWVRDLPILDAQTRLLVHRRRLWCVPCAAACVENLSWLDRYGRVTRRLARSVARLCAVLPIKHVAEFFGLRWDQVKAIHWAHLKETLGPPDLSGLEVIAMDEFALHKGRQYATVVVEPTRKRVLWVGRGHRREDIRPFFESLGEEGRRRLKAVAMDMYAPYEGEVRAQCPHTEVVYDLFHVVALYGQDVIDRVRVDEANRLRHDPDARRVIKGSRWLLLRNKENLTRPEDRVRLAELLDANRALLAVYVLKDDLKQLWDFRRRKTAKRF
jgi:transposase